LSETVKEEETKLPWRAANEGPLVPEEQYQERFWRRRRDGIGLDTATKEFLTIEFKRTQDARSNYVERATAVAQEQYKNLLAGLQAVGQVKGWKVQQIVFVGGTCGSIHVESFNRNMKALGVLASKWDPIRKKLVRCLARVCCLLVLDSVTSTPQWIRQPKPRDFVHDVCVVCVNVCSEVLGIFSPWISGYAFSSTLTFSLRLMPLTLA
jgi:hypothetical protein